MLSDAVDSMIEKLTPSSPVLAWLLDYINERIADDKRWNVSNEVKSFGRNIFDESYIERGEGLRFKLRSPETIKLYRDVLREMETDALEQMKGFYDQFEGELEGHALVPEDLKGGARGIGSYFRKLRDGRLADKDVLNATPAKLPGGRQELGYQDIFAQGRDYPPCRNQPDTPASGCGEVPPAEEPHDKQLPPLAATPQQTATAQSHRRRSTHPEPRAQPVSAVRHQCAAAQISARSDSSFVFEKIGANIRNVMIDEFQDTSRMQWDNFRLLLLEGLRRERTASLWAM